MLQLLKSYKIKETEYTIDIFDSYETDAHKLDGVNIDSTFYCNLHQVIDPRAKGLTFIFTHESAAFPSHWSIKNIPMPSTLPIVYPKDTLGANISLKLGDLLRLGLLEELQAPYRVVKVTVEYA